MSDPAVALIQAERALMEIRAGRPVVLVDGAQGFPVLGVEALGPALAASDPAASDNDADIAASTILLFPGGRARLILPAPRLRRLGLAGREVPGAIDLSLDDRAGLDALVTQRTPPLAGLADRVLPVSATEVAALDLLQQALVLPAVLVGGRRPVAAFAAADFVQLDWTFVALARSHRAAQMTIISRAPVPLDGAVKTEFVVFRGGEGLRDHVAIIVGTPDLSQPVAVRLHSACLTGDLFGSLKCDCGDQLRGTVQHMASAQGGIVLYLDQEGRGNGLANKIRAYSLQAQGYDTYDADEILGFDHDQRHFDFAALMLRQLGVDRVRLMTNNPDKITALIRSGIDVVASTRIHGRVNAHNQAYLDTKRDRAGHLMDTKP